MAYEGTINLLSNFASQKYAANLQKEAPQYKQALFNLMQAKEQALNQKTLLDRLRGAGTYQEQLEIMGQAGNEKALTELSDINQESQKLSQTRNLEVNNVLEKFDVPEKLIPMLIEGIQKTGSIPVKVAPYLKQKPNTLSVSLSPFDRSQQGALGSASARAMSDIPGILAIKDDFMNVLGSFNKIPEMFKGPLAGRTVGVAGKLGANDDVVTFEDTKELILSNIAKKLGGEVGVLTDKDIERIKVALPSLKDSKQTAEDKIKFVTNYVDRRIKAKQQVANLTPTGLSLPSDLYDDKYEELVPLLEPNTEAGGGDTTVDPLDDYLNNLLGR